MKGRSTTICLSIKIKTCNLFFTWSWTAHLLHCLNIRSNRCQSVQNFLTWQSRIKPVSIAESQTANILLCVQHPLPHSLSASPIRLPHRSRHCWSFQSPFIDTQRHQQPCVVWSCDSFHNLHHCIVHSRDQSTQSLETFCSVQGRFKASTLLLPFLEHDLLACWYNDRRLREWADKRADKRCTRWLNGKHQ